MTEPRTLLEVLQSTTAYFQKHQVESPRLNAEHLLAHALGLTRMDLYLEFERKLSEAELVPLRELVKRRAQAEPLQHLLGTVEFCGQTFLCDKRALVPRQESEQVKFRKGDLLEDLNERFDLIVANLPYVSMQDRQSLAREVLHDPEVALFAGEKGDEIVRRLIEQAPSHLEPGGLLALEIGINQSEGLTELLRLKNYHDIRAKKDYAGIARFLLASYG